MNVLIIPEDFRKDQYVIRPLVKRILKEVGKPNAKVRVCFDPLLGSVEQAKKWSRIQEILDMYPMVHLFLLLIDRDGKPGRRKHLDRLETNAAVELGESKAFFAENAWQEIEVWALAGQQDLPNDWSWQEIRNEPNPKKRYFEPHAESRGLTKEPGEGRKTMGREAAANYSRVRSRCKEDIEALENRLQQWVSTNYRPLRSQ